MFYVTELNTESVIKVIINKDNLNFTFINTGIKTALKNKRQLKIVRVFWVIKMLIKEIVTNAFILCF